MRGTIGKIYDYDHVRWCEVRNRGEALKDALGRPIMRAKIPSDDPKAVKENMYSLAIAVGDTVYVMPVFAAVTQQLEAKNGYVFWSFTETKEGTQNVVLPESAKIAVAFTPKGEVEEFEIALGVHYPLKVVGEHLFSVRPVGLDQMPGRRYGYDCEKQIVWWSVFVNIGRKEVLDVTEMERLPLVMLAGGEKRGYMDPPSGNCQILHLPNQLLLDKKTDINRESTEDPLCNPQSIRSIGAGFVRDTSGRVLCTEYDQGTGKGILWIQGRPVKQGGRFVFYQKRLAPPDSVIEVMPSGATITHKLADLG